MKSYDSRKDYGDLHKRADMRLSTNERIFVKIFNMQDIQLEFRSGS